MAQDVRELLPLPDPQHPQPHGQQTDAAEEHDLHLVRGVVPRALVGKVSTVVIVCMMIH